MTKENRWRVVDDLMNGIWNSDEWNRLQTNDPRIQAAETAFHALLYSLTGTIEKETCWQMEETIGELEAAMADTAILYGIHVANSIQLAAANPASYSAHRLEPDKT